MNLTPSQARRQLWQRGELDFLLDPKQLEIKQKFKSQANRIGTVLCARRFGKTYLLMSMALETCIRKPFATVKYICPQLKQGVNNISEVMRYLLETCPEDLRPIWATNDKKWNFPNGSQVQVAGTDNGSHESLRGGSSDLNIVDEAGFCDHLDYVVKSILVPTTLTTRGKIYLVSTPSKTYNHDFIQIYVLPERQTGNLVKYTIHDNPRLTEEDIEIIKSLYPTREKDPHYRREYECDIINDADTVVIPEADEEKMKTIVTSDIVYPPFYDAYTAGDVGFRDLTVYLFAYYDFIKATIVVVDELVMNGPGMTTDVLAARIIAKEAEHFSGSAGPKRVYQRYMDNNLIMMNDLNRLHQLNFVATAKDNKEAQINLVRQKVAKNQIKIHPRCKHLIYHLQNAMWKNSTNQNRIFDHLADSQDKTIRGGHADALDALIYLTRNVVYSHNPYPKDYDVKYDDHNYNSRKTFAKKVDTTSETMDAFKRMLNVNRLKQRK